jgi:hypothetical protein
MQNSLGGKGERRAVIEQDESRELIAFSIPYMGIMGLNRAIQDLKPFLKPKNRSINIQKSEKLFPPKPRARTEPSPATGQ